MKKMLVFVMLGLLLGLAGTCFASPTTVASVGASAYVTANGVLPVIPPPPPPARVGLDGVLPVIPPPPPPARVGLDGVLPVIPPPPPPAK